jgi:hypothetical protein
MAEKFPRTFPRYNYLNLESVSAGQTSNRPSRYKQLCWERAGSPGLNRSYRPCKGCGRRNQSPSHLCTCRLNKSPQSCMRRSCRKPRWERAGSPGLNRSYRPCKGCGRRNQSPSHPCTSRLNKSPQLCMRRSCTKPCWERAGSPGLDRSYRSCKGCGRRN